MTFEKMISYSMVSQIKREMHFIYPLSKSFVPPVVWLLRTTYEWNGLRGEETFPSIYRQLFKNQNTFQMHSFLLWYSVKNIKFIPILRRIYKNREKIMNNLSIFCLNLFIAYIFRRVHESDVQRLAFGALLLLAVRHTVDWFALCPPRGTSLLC